jgi:DNA-binding response OmpR family regulator
MNENPREIRLLLVDDETEFRQTTAVTLQRRGFAVTEAEDGVAALRHLEAERPDIVILDLKMPGMGGLGVLRRLRALHPDLPVVILSGHGTWEDALAGIRLEITEFLQKPVDLDELAPRLREMATANRHQPLRERTIRELMVPPGEYPQLVVSQPVEEAVDLLKRSYFGRGEFAGRSRQLRSALVRDRDGTFLGILRFHDILKLVIPTYLGDSAYVTYFTGMFLSQCKVLGKRTVRDILDPLIQVDVDAPLMEAVDLLVRNRLVNLPVMEGGRLVGVLRERDVIFEIAEGLGVP